MAKSVTIADKTGSIPRVGLGTWTDFVHQDIEVENAVCTALDNGYRHIDTAWLYGTQRAIGKAMTRKIKEGSIKREDIFITTKLWNTHHSPDAVMDELKLSLEELQTSYVDLFLMHWPMAFQNQDFSTSVLIPVGEDGEYIPAAYSIEDVWKAMEECQTAGLTKTIGVSNFNSKQIERILNICTIKPFNVQIEISPYLSNRRLRDYCYDKGISVTAYAPLGAPNSLWFKGEKPNVFQDQILKDISAKTGKTIAQVVIRFHLQQGLIVIPKSITPSRIKENIDVFDFELCADDIERIASLNRNLRVFDVPNATTNAEYPFNEPF